MSTGNSKEDPVFLKKDAKGGSGSTTPISDTNNRRDSGLKSPLCVDVSSVSRMHAKLGPAREYAKKVGHIDPCTNVAIVRNVAHAQNFVAEDDDETSAGFQLIDFCSGFIAGIAGVIVGHPFDTIKVRQQVKGTEYRSLYKCVTRTASQEGVAGFYKGLLVPLLTEGGRNCLFFGVYERIRNHDPSNPVCYSSVAGAGALAGAVQALPATPIELAKIKLQQQTEKHKRQREFRGPVHCLRHIIRHHGIGACFRGLTPCVLRDVSGFAAYMTSYEFLCRRFHPDGPGHCSIWVLLLTGGMAGAFSWLINLPLDYIKSRLQADSLSKPQYRGTVHCVGKVLAEEGGRVLYRGLPAVMMRAFVLNAVTLTVYSSCRRHLQAFYRQDADENPAPIPDSSKFAPVD